MRKSEIVRRLIGGETICMRDRYGSEGKRFRALFLAREVGQEAGDDLHGGNFRGVSSMLRVAHKRHNGREVQGDSVPVCEEGDTVEVYYTLKDR